MTVEEMILAWKNQDYAMSLGEEQHNAIMSPVGEAGAALAGLSKWEIRRGTLTYKGTLTKV